MEEGHFIGVTEIREVLGFDIPEHREIPKIPFERETSERVGQLGFQLELRWDQFDPAYVITAASLYTECLNTCDNEDEDEDFINTYNNGAQYVIGSGKYVNEIVGMRWALVRRESIEVDGRDLLRKLTSLVDWIEKEVLFSAMSGHPLCEVGSDFRNRYNHFKVEFEKDLS